MWLPAITHHFPGSGITVHNVWSTPYEWWHIYANHVEAMNTEARRGK